MSFFFFFFNDTATTEIYTLSLHDALPIYRGCRAPQRYRNRAAPGEGIPAEADPGRRRRRVGDRRGDRGRGRSEEHTSELQSQSNLVCRLLLEKKKTKRNSKPQDQQATS